MPWTLWNLFGPIRPTQTQVEQALTREVAHGLLIALAWDKGWEELNVTSASRATTHNSWTFATSRGTFHVFDNGLITNDWGQTFITPQS